MYLPAASAAVVALLGLTSWARLGRQRRLREELLGLVERYFEMPTAAGGGDAHKVEQLTALWR